jgi:hypothetical protein
MTAQKGLKIVPVQGISPEQLAALNKWAADYREAKPKLAAIAKTAKDIHGRAVAAPVWRVAEGTPEPGQEKPTDMPGWNIGAPKVNYVDHIEVSSIADAKLDGERNAE